MSSAERIVSKVDTNLRSVEGVVSIVECKEIVRKINLSIFERSVSSE